MQKDLDNSDMKVGLEPFLHLILVLTFSIASTTYLWLGLTLHTIHSYKDFCP